MNRLHQTILIFLLALGLVIPCGLSAASSYRPSANQQGKEQLDLIRDESNSIRNTLSSMSSRTRFGDMDRDSQGLALTEVREDVIKIGKDIHALQAMDASLASWQQRELARLTPLAKDLASQTTEAIRTFDQNSLKVQDLPLANDFQSIFKKAGEMRNSVSESEKVASLRKEMHQLESRG